MVKFKYLFISLFIFLPLLLSAQTSIEGDWKGLLSIGLDFAVHFKSDAGSLTGTMDIPSQQAMGLPLKNVSYNAPDVHFELESPLGLAALHGVLEGDSIKGKFSQGSISADFFLVRGMIEPPPPPELLPYQQEAVTFNNGDTRLTGTLTLPQYAGNHPAVVLITGSGAQTRDEEIFGFKLFQVIADHLTRNGIAVLRYDDRGTGGSTGEVSQSTTADFAGDVVSAVKFLQSRNDIRKDQVGLLGHSEGGIVAPIAYTMDNSIAFLVLMAGTGVTGEEIIYEQSKLLMRAEKVEESVISQSDAMLRKMFTAVKEGKAPETLKEDIYNLAYAEYDKLSEEEKKLSSKEDYALRSYEQQTKEFYSPWFKYFLTYDPAPTLEKVDIPVLLLYGENDLQVIPAQNRKPMEDALIKGGNKRYEVVVIPKANHLFQEAVTGGISEYAVLKKEFAPGFLDAVTNWILKHVSLSR